MFRRAALASLAVALTLFPRSGVAAPEPELAPNPDATADPGTAEPPADAATTTGPTATEPSGPSPGRGEPSSSVSATDPTAAPHQPAEAGPVANRPAPNRPDASPATPPSTDPATAPVAPAPPADDIAAPPPPEPEPSAGSDPPVRQLAPPPVELEVDPANYRLSLAGNVLVGVGGAGFIVMAAGLLVGFDARNRQRNLRLAETPDLDAIAELDGRVGLGDGLAIAGGVSAAVLVATGISLIAVARTRESRRRSQLSAALPSPTLGRHGVALTWSFRL